MLSTQVHLRVSSIKLIMSSPYFKAMLTGDRYPEGRNLAENGSVRIDLSDTEDDPEAMMVILGLLYNTSNHVDAPAQIELSTLINITMLVDKYQWHELVTPHATHWFETIKPQIISKFSSLPSNMQIKVFVGDLGLRTRRSLQNSYMTMEHSLHTIDTSDPEVLLPTRVMSKSYSSNTQASMVYYQFYIHVIRI